MTRVTVPAGYAANRSTPLAQLELVPVEGSSRDASEVFWGGDSIGYVWKGHRTYSPPMHRGSRIVRYRKQVPEWQGHPTDQLAMGISAYRRDSRREVLRLLIAEAVAKRA